MNVDECEANLMSSPLMKPFKAFGRRRQAVSYKKRFLNDADLEAKNYRMVGKEASHSRIGTRSE